MINRAARYTRALLLRSNAKPVRVCGSQEDEDEEEESPKPRLFGFGGTRKVKKSAKEAERAVKAAPRPAKRVAMQVGPRRSKAPDRVSVVQCHGVATFPHLLFIGPPGMGDGNEQLPWFCNLSRLHNPVCRFKVLSRLGSDWLHSFDCLGDREGMFPHARRRKARRETWLKRPSPRRRAACFRCCLSTPPLSFLLASEKRMAPYVGATCRYDKNDMRR